MKLQSPLLLPEEACVYLRLDVGRDMPAALKSLDHLVECKLLRPCKVGRCRRYLIGELHRFMQAQVDRYGELHG